MQSLRDILQSMMSGNDCRMRHYRIYLDWEDDNCYNNYYYGA